MAGLCAGHFSLARSRFQHDLRANAARLSRGKPLRTPDQVGGMLFRIMLYATGSHVMLQELRQLLQ